MNYRDIVNNYFDVSSDSVDNEIKFRMVRYVSSLIKESSYYNNLDFGDRNNLDNYIGKSILLFENKIGFDRKDCIVNGLNIPPKYLMEKMIYDSSNRGVGIPSKMAEIIKKQVRTMRPYKLSRMYENGGGYRLVFEMDEDICEISIKGK